MHEKCSEITTIFDGGTLFEARKEAENSQLPIKCVAKYGHLYNAETNKRIVFVEGSTCKLSEAEYRHIEEETPKPKKVKARGDDFKKILEKGTELYFFIFEQKYTFTCVLLDDLYMKKTGKGGYRQYPYCLCKTVNASNNFEYFEIIYAYTLAELFRKTCILYNEDKTCANGKAISCFYTSPQKDNKYKLKNVCDKVFEERLAKAKATAKEKLEKLKKMEI